MEQLDNISQLRNLWLRSSDERLTCWREFRLELQATYVCNDPLPSLKAISMWWNFAPIVSVAMDPFSLKTWPSVWEIIIDGECCKYSRGVAMAYNMHYLDETVNVKIARVLDTKYNDEYLVAIWNDRYALNTMHNDVLDLQENKVDLVIKESWTIQDIINEKQN